MPETILSFDLGILHFLHDQAASEAMDAAMTFITRLGDGGFLWFAIAVVLIAQRKFRAFGIAVVVAVIMDFAIGDIVLKNIVERPRPFLADPDLTTALIPLPGSFSFPSGHTGSSFAAATVLAAIPFSQGWKQAALRVLPFAVAAAVAFSRLYLCVHFPTDVAVGCLLGIACGLLTLKTLHPALQEPAA